MNHNNKGKRLKKRKCINGNTNEEECYLFPEIDYQYEDCYMSNCNRRDFLEKYNNEIDMNRISSLHWTTWSDCINYDNNCNNGFKFRHLSCGHVDLKCEFVKIEIQNSRLNDKIRVHLEPKRLE